jgi:hypothetical protein
MTAATTTPRVWIGCLASYNAGRLIGEWCEATDVDVMNDTWEDVKVQAVRAARAAGEYPVYFGEPEEPFLADNESCRRPPAGRGRRATASSAAGAAPPSTSTSSTRSAPTSTGT